MHSSLSSHMIVPTSLALVTMLVTGSGKKAHAAERRPVSITVGCIEYKNWEENLVRNNPNLRHYHWNPIYSNVQAVHLVGPMNPPPMRGTWGPKKQGTPPGFPKERPLFYKKPTTPHFAYNPGIYKKPVHMVPQRSTTTTGAYVHVAAGTDLRGKMVPQQPNLFAAQDMQQSKSGLNGKLKPHQPGLIAHGKKLSVPGDKKVHGTLAHKDVSGQLMHKDVQGQLVAQAVSATFTGNTAKMMDDTGARIYYPYASSHADNVNNNLSRSNVNGRVSNKRIQLRNY